MDDTEFWKQAFAFNPDVHCAHGNWGEFDRLMYIVNAELTLAHIKFDYVTKNTEDLSMRRRYGEELLAIRKKYNAMHEYQTKIKIKELQNKQYTPNHTSNIFDDLKTIAQEPSVIV